MDKQIAIDKIKELVGLNDQTSNLQIVPGDGISLSRNQNKLTISTNQQPVDPPQVYTLTICVNGTPKLLNVLTLGAPY